MSVIYLEKVARNMIHIRPETPADYAAIADIHIQAFGNRSAEASIVSLLRHRESYDAGLSLVATKDNRVIGHALFMPYIVHFTATPIQAVNLAPIGIHPDFQKQGVGGALMTAGHRAAQRKGYSIAFLLGHPGYYPRFGYQTKVYGHSTITVTREHLIMNVPTVESRSPLPQDVERLHEIWLYDEQTVDFSIQPESNLNAWLSPNPTFAATVYLINGRVVGYTRGTQEQPRMFIADSAESTRAIVSHLLKFNDRVILPLHPASKSMHALPIEAPAIKGWDAGMIHVLSEQAPVRDYLNAIATGQRPVGRMIWPPAFDMG